MQREREASEKQLEHAKRAAEESKERERADDLEHQLQQVPFPLPSYGLHMA